MIVQIDIHHLPSGRKVSGIEQLEDDELEGLKSLMSDAVSGRVTYIKLLALDGSDVFIGKNILIDSVIHVNELSKKSETK